MKFEWDSAKSDSNLRERGLDFADAIPAFEDASRKIWQDERRDYGEERFNMLAKSAERVFFVAFTLRYGMVRIISFRKANQREISRYEQR
jgi:uncharacterized protein